MRFQRAVGVMNFTAFRALVKYPLISRHGGQISKYVFPRIQSYTRKSILKSKEGENQQVA
jgi:hypothetical protein